MLNYINVDRIRRVLERIKSYIESNFYTKTEIDQKLSEFIDAETEEY